MSSDLVPFIANLMKYRYQNAWLLLVYKLGVLGHFAPGVFLGLEVLRHFGLKNKTRKIFEQ